jgi:hypothetical protein
LLNVSLVWPLPSAFITQISGGGPSSRLLWKAICVPVGDHAGAVSSPLAYVSRTGGVSPFVGITQMSSPLPSLSARLLANAIFEPSGDQAGCSSSLLVVVSRRSWRPATNGFTE